MTLISKILSEVEYPDTDGLPMAESDLKRSYLSYAVEVLRIHFQSCWDAYVSGNLFIYYEPGNPKAVVAPDVFVVFGVDKSDRRSYKTWESNNKVPNFVLEITSESTVSEDQGSKRGLYAFLGVKEYFQYDPTGDYLKPQLKGLRLVEDNYLPLETTTLVDGSLSVMSEVLGLELRLQDGEMRFYNPITGGKLLTHQETEQARQQAIPRLLEMGLSVEQVAVALSLAVEEVRAFV